MNYSKEVQNYLYSNQNIFIQIIDKIRLKNNKVAIVLPGGSLKYGLAAISGSAMYLKMEDIKDSALFDEIIEENRNIFSIYGNTNELDNLTILKNKNTYKYDYYVMALKKEDFVPSNVFTNDHDVKLCSLDDFEKLRDLQYKYHLEEVYCNCCHYPYEFEMKNFRKMLKDRKNISFSIGDKAVSKAYVNSESNDTYQIGGVFTLKEYRGNGYAKKTMEYFVKILFEEKENIQLFVKKENTKAVNLYKNIGFSVLSETSNIYIK